VVPFFSPPTLVVASPVSMWTGGRMPVYIVPVAARPQGSSFGPSSPISAHDVRIAKRRQGNLALEPVARLVKMIAKQKGGKKHG